jgi:hypothetical protein
MMHLHPRSAQRADEVLQHILRGVYDYYDMYDGIEAVT